MILAGVSGLMSIPLTAAVRCENEETSSSCIRYKYLYDVNYKRHNKQYNFHPFSHETKQKMEITSAKLDYRAINIHILI
jgi:hypothetical protein